MIIQIEGLGKGQELAIMDLMALWADLGEQGVGRWTSIYGDGSTDFKPKIKVDGADPQRVQTQISSYRWKQVMIPDGEGRHFQDEVYMLDPHEIIMALKHSGDNAHHEL